MNQRPPVFPARRLHSPAIGSRPRYNIFNSIVTMVISSTIALSTIKFMTIAVQ